MTQDQLERWLQWTVLGYEVFVRLEQSRYGERGINLKDSGQLIGTIGIVPYLDSFGEFAAFKASPTTLATDEVGHY